MDRYPAATEVVPQAEATLELAAVLAEWAIVNASVNVHLVDEDFIPDATLEAADLHEATFAGYAAKAATIASMTLDQREADGSVRLQSTTLLSWPGPTSDGPVTIYGYYLTEVGATTRLFRAYRLGSPRVLRDDNDWLQILLAVSGFGGALAT